MIQIWASLNRTKLELKRKQKKLVFLQSKTLNRTKLELKQHLHHVGCVENFVFKSHQIGIETI